MQNLRLYPWLEPADFAGLGVYAREENSTERPYYCEEEDRVSCLRGGFGIVSGVGAFNDEMPSDDIVSFLKNSPKYESDCQEKTNEAASKSSAGDDQDQQPHGDQHKCLNPKGERTGNHELNFRRLLTDLATATQIELAHRLIDTLSEAVRKRVVAQADVCGLCLHSRIIAMTDTHGCDKTNEVAKTATSHHPMTELRTPLSETLGSTIPVPSADQVSKFPQRDKEMDSSSHTECFGPVQIVDSLTSGCCDHARVSVLFSGGIDSLVVAALADRLVPRPIFYNMLTKGTP